MSAECDSFKADQLIIEILEQGASPVMSFGLLELPLETQCIQGGGSAVLLPRSITCSPLDESGTGKINCDAK